jgi:hypothetical protein
MHMANMMPMLVGQFLATKPFFQSSRQWETADSRRIQQFFSTQGEQWTQGDPDDHEAEVAV